MPYLPSEREYRSMPVMKIADTAEERLIDSEYYVQGYATTFNQPYVLFKDDEYTYYEQVDRAAFNEADMSDVIFLHNHTGKCLARNKMKVGKEPTLILRSDDVGLFVAADLGIIEEGREEWRAITGGLVYQMSFGFTVAEDEVTEIEKGSYLRTIKRIKRLYDVSSVDMPANPYTAIDTNARSAFEGYIERQKQELQRAEERKRQIQRIRILSEVNK